VKLSEVPATTAFSAPGRDADHPPPRRRLRCRPHDLRRRLRAGATPESYLAARERLLSTVSHFSPADQAKVAGGTALALFKFT